MQGKLKSAYIKNYISKYLDSFLEFNVSTKLHLELKTSDLVNALNPFLLNEYIKEINSTMMYLSWEQSCISKVKEESPLVYEALVAEGSKEEVVKLIYDLKETLKLITLNSLDLSTPIEYEIVDDFTIRVNNTVIPKDSIEEKPSEITIAICKSFDELKEYYQTNPQITKLDYAGHIFETRHMFKKPKEEYFVLLLKDNKVIGMTSLFTSPDHEDCLCASFTSIMENEQGKGYSDLLLEKRFELLQSLGKTLHQSSYSTIGFERLRPKVQDLAEKYNVAVKENGLLDPAENFSQVVYQSQKSMAEIVKDLKAIDSVIESFLKENPHTIEDKKEFYKKYKSLIGKEGKKYL